MTNKVFKKKSKCRKDTENINPRVSKTSNNRTMILSKCAMVVKNQDLLKIKNQKDCLVI